ncbi:hypothetical protein MiYa_02772 [Microcystis aeruginosa NIES-2519]|uniref:DUF4926 domain-containing protein n=1 Tax=Microcystis aeruginosa NIES-2519 TaxID=2303981 RepID=A0A5A5R4P3_MICAE|nr:MULTISPECIES: DUF4926 domain-containing protein [Microcystis]GCA71233.1 hypothetical protein MiYa_02772 [Microcystis aeruginosa NIES-2519]GCA83323.1 hypothetical protein MiHa_01284 [Microcystis aeruginosa NIES-2522]
MNFTQWDFIKRYSRSKIIRRRRGKLVEKHQIEGLERGYSVEFSDRLRKTITVVTMAENSLRFPTPLRTRVKLINHAGV